MDAEVGVESQPIGARRCDRPATSETIHLACPITEAVAGDRLTGLEHPEITGTGKFASRQARQ
ncbi:MAG: hypothetical protein E6J90_38865 [Deltaproteobacteria bacterium]|nr:MAG: hypothetical protein E6J90_38865 [Deltaproteobacteria bacterium]